MKYYYNVELSDSAKKFLKSLDGSIKNRVEKFIDSLEVEPIPRDKKHILESVGPSMLCEGRVDKLRFYYTIENQFVVIAKIKYRGSVEIIEVYSNHKSGNKQNNPYQRRDIKRLKDWFLSLFRNCIKSSPSQK